MKRGLLLRLSLLASASALIAVPGALGSVLIARSANNVQLKITRQGQALVEYTKGGSKQYVLLWGALNARAHPTCGKIQGSSCGPAQVELSHKRLFPSGAAGRKIINGPNACHKYDGPELGWLVAACKAPDGTYWAAQSWVRIARNHSSTDSGVKELRISHWSGPLEKVVVKQTWQKAKGHYGERLYGQATYRGKPVYGLRWNGVGVPLDGYGRVIYFDTFNSHYGSGWHRLDGFLSKPMQGQFCYNIGLRPRGHWQGAGEHYRATAMGVGVTPDIMVNPFAAKPEALFDWNAYVESYHEQLQLSKGTHFCTPQAPR